MIIIFIKMNVIPEKRKELLQTIQAIKSRIQNEKGCLSFRIFEEIGKEAAYSLVEEWRTQKDFDRHLNSDIFSILMGAVNILSEQPKMMVSNSVHVMGKDLMKASNEYLSSGTL